MRTVTCFKQAEMRRVLIMFASQLTIGRYCHICRNISHYDNRMSGNVEVKFTLHA